MLTVRLPSRLLQGHDGIRIMDNNAQLYGLYSFTAIVNDEPGVICAAYVSMYSMSLHVTCMYCTVCWCKNHCW
jgi:hypothetical protein